MPEYAHAVGIPAKPMASKAIGKAVEHGQWDEVREQVLADVFTAAIIANRHLISAARVSGDVDASDATIFSELAAACPWSKWLNLQTRGWDLHREDRRVLLIRWRHDSHQNHPPELCLEGPKLL